MEMNGTLMIIVAIVAIIAIAALIFSNKRRSEHLRSRFGSEYERQVEELGSRSKAEADLAQREKRVSKLAIRPLSPADQDRFFDRWTKVQATFVDDPERSVDYADALLAEVMNARGYPVSDFEQRAGDISVDHPNVVQHYRAGHEIALRHSRGEANTDELRQALIHYRALFEELVTERAPVPENSL
jgi:FtsZ-interacting cell division protein ZipA